MKLPFVLPALLAGAAAAQEPAPAPTPPASRPIARPADPDCQALALRYGAALRDYDELRIRRARVQSPTPEPAHPARRFLAEYEALAAKGSGCAQSWILENLAFAAEEPAERRRIAREVFPKLLGHVDEEPIYRAIDGLRGVLPDLGEDVVLEMATSIAEKTSVDEVRGQAKLLQAFARTQGETTKDPERWKEAEEIHKELVYTLPKTNAGRQAAGVLFGPLEEELYARERRWVDELLELERRGTPPEEWPRQPMHDLLPEFQVIANASHTPAQAFVDHLYPEYAAVERQGPGFACAWLAKKFGQYYSDGLGGRWNAVRADLLVVAYRRFPNERWVLESLRDLAGQFGMLPFDRIELAMQPLLEKATDPRVRAAALYALGQSVQSRGDVASYERAIAYYARIRDEHPKDTVRPAAESALAALAPAMPGQPAPPTKLDDVEGLPLDLQEYRGRVVMLEFWSFHWPAFLEGLPARIELDRQYEGRPFSLVGVNLDHRKPAAFHELARKHGIRWRCASTYSSNKLLATWAARLQPTTILVDREGIIRARDLPWAEMKPLVETLVAEAEKNR